METQLASQQKELHMRVAEIRTSQDKQVQEVCLMIEELAKVVKSFEGQIQTMRMLQAEGVGVECKRVEKAMVERVEGERRKREEEISMVVNEIK